MTWYDYIVTVAAPHSRYNAQLWFRYLRKDIEKIFRKLKQIVTDDNVKSEDVITDNLAFELNSISTF